MQKLKSLLFLAALTIATPIMAQTVQNMELQKNVTLQPGVYAMPGTYDIPNDVFEIGIEFTRNSWPSTGTNYIFEAFVDISVDGGQSWPYTIEVRAIGGIMLNKFGQEITREFTSQGFPTGVNRKARLRYNITQPMRTTIKLTLISP